MKNNIITCRDLGITGTDADLVMGDSEFIELCQAGEADAAAVRAHVLLNPSIETKPWTEDQAAEFQRAQEEGRIAEAVERHAQGLMSAYVMARRDAGNPTTRKERIELMEAIRREGRDGETSKRLNAEIRAAR